MMGPRMLPCTLNDFPTFPTFNQCILLKSLVLQKDISVTKSMPFSVIEEVPVQTRLLDGANFRRLTINRTKIFTSAFKFRTNYSHINL